MDAKQFDGFTRRFATRLGRRQLLGGLAAVAGITAGRRPAAAQDSCPYRYQPCSIGCCPECDPPRSLTCGMLCFDPNHEYQPYCADFDRSRICQARPFPDNPEITTRVCYFGPTREYPYCVYDPPQCAPSQAWDEDTCSCMLCEGDRYACNSVCCADDEECVDGTCVAACALDQQRARTSAARRADKGANRASAADSCGCPEPDMLRCQGQCFYPCPQDEVFDFNSCTCQCLGATCGRGCCPLGEECASEGGADFPPKCCPKGESCGGQCLKSGQKCCKHAQHGQVACPKDAACCFGAAIGGGRCCRSGQKCKQGRCVKKKAAKR